MKRDAAGESAYLTTLKSKRKATFLAKKDQTIVEKSPLSWVRYRHTHTHKHSHYVRDKLTRVYSESIVSDGGSVNQFRSNDKYYEKGTREE